MQGVEEGSTQFSLESDGWEEPRRGVSTCPALIPGRQGTARPARNSSGCGECLTVETHSLRKLKWEQKKQAHLPPLVPKIPDTCAESSAGRIPVNGAHGTGVPLACCIGGCITSLSDIGALIPPTQCELLTAQGSYTEI